MPARGKEVGRELARDGGVRMRKAAQSAEGCAILPRATSHGRVGPFVRGPKQQSHESWLRAKRAGNGGRGGCREQRGLWDSSSARAVECSTGVDNSHARDFESAGAGRRVERPVVGRSRQAESRQLSRMRHVSSEAAALPAVVAGIRPALVAAERVGLPGRHLRRSTRTETWRGRIQCSYPRRPRCGLRSEEALLLAVLRTGALRLEDLHLAGMCIDGPGARLGQGHPAAAELDRHPDIARVPELLRLPAIVGSIFGT